MKRIRALLRAVGQMLSAPRPAELALLSVVLFAIYLYLPLRLTFGPGSEAGPVASSGRAPAIPIDEVDPDRKLRLPTPPYVATGNGAAEIDRNPFAYHVARRTPRPRKTPRPVLRTTPVPTPTPEATPTPPPPYKSPFTLVGLIEREGAGGKKIAVLSSGDQIHVALEGWDVEVRNGSKTTVHRVKHVGLDRVRVGPPDGPAEVTLKLKEKKTAAAGADGRRGRRRGRRR